MKPLRELEGLRYDEEREKKINVGADNAYKLESIAGDAYELVLEVKSPTSKEFGIDVLCDKDGKAGLRIAVLADSKTLRVGTVNAPFELKEGEDLQLRVFVDKNLV